MNNMIVIAAVDFTVIIASIAAFSSDSDFDCSPVVRQEKT
jgi:hypothetical protein